MSICELQSHFEFSRVVYIVVLHSNCSVMSASSGTGCRSGSTPRRKPGITSSFLFIFIFILVSHFMVDIQKIVKFFIGFLYRALTTTHRLHSIKFCCIFSWWAKRYIGWIKSRAVIELYLGYFVLAGGRSEGRGVW